MPATTKLWVGGEGRCQMPKIPTNRRRRHSFQEVCLALGPNSLPRYGLEKSIKLLPPPEHVGEQTCRRRRDSGPESRRANKMERKQRRRLLRVQEQRSNERGGLLYSVFLSGRIHSEGQKKAKAPRRLFKKDVQSEGDGLKNCLILRSNCLL